jgi:hypothetical protein
LLARKDFQTFVIASVGYHRQRFSADFYKVVSRLSGGSCA